MPDCGSSIVLPENVTATTGATYGQQHRAPATTPRPRNGLRSANAAIRPDHDRPDRARHRVDQRGDTATTRSPATVKTSTKFSSV